MYKERSPKQTLHCLSKCLENLVALMSECNISCTIHRVILYNAVGVIMIHLALSYIQVTILLVLMKHDLPILIFVLYIQRCYEFCGQDTLFLATRVLF